MASIKWGILGCGNIAKKFATGLSVIPDADLVAVGSRTQEKADAFADAFNVPKRHDSYEALASDPDVDVIYVATPHSHHQDNTILCLRHKKAVLCEKPFAINADETREMVRVARQEKVFLMEAMWTRFVPSIVKLREIVENGTIGDVRCLVADFGYRVGTINPEARTYNPDLGGGALLDVGIYPISFASLIMQTQPSQIVSLANLGQTGVDEQSGWIFTYDDGRMAIGYTAIRTSTPHEATVMGTKGQIRAERSFWCGSPLTLNVGGNIETIEVPMEGNGYNYEAVEVMNCLRAGKLESDVMPLDESIQLMETLDRVRQPWGLVYPQER